ncbi:alpha/beta fold hydrolase [Tsukamurella ocularis]|uniref:alpha/beta fold hydrolase n=1 Tax=Tsukamurella ocularis TaxID=1970234 RepID=UPI002167D2E2|nr:alpha/beta hydrolase [Tsukamurella ocularis]MCS3782291.1 pimeloyl-ACP methyl ester carboxylesterase [Tsukamurella ocularis]MCS3789549.1 pimeloyl-ACP methyl ester carboxylesterase [Tsukamurella ocularis]MCS3852696.1 pimeloyl-ACP methyl ester carboxylesterase [Tsukamurella ocularis]
MTDGSGATVFASVGDGRIAYDVVGEGPLIVLSPGLADTRATYRFLAPRLVDAGYRVATVDLRGHGDSSARWSSFTRADTASDLAEVITDLGGGPAIVVGQSFSGGAATILAAERPDLVAAVIEIAPFTRPPSLSLAAFLRDGAYRRGTFLLGGFGITGSPRRWSQYLDMAYPTRKPSDWDSWKASVLAGLEKPDRRRAATKMVLANAKDAAEALPHVTRPTLIIMGSQDSDFADPVAEAKGIVAALPDSIGSYVTIDGAGHYPHAEFPDEVATHILRFLTGLRLA